jgi:membrane glycosyltransferase
MRRERIKEMHENEAYRRGVTAKRAAMLALVLTSTALAASLMSQVIAANGLDIIGCASLVLFTLNFGWLSLSFWGAVFGFVAQLKGRNFALPPTASASPLRQRTAVVMPIYNEGVARVSAGLEATLVELTATNEAAHFDIFVLSDTRDAKTGAAEQVMVTRLRRQYPAGPQIYYRRRERNLGRKAGNIADFVRRWGAAYAHMVVFDADSVMSGTTLVSLARLMEAHPDAGIIQTLPVPTNRETAFARIQQFASRVYGPMLASGLACWTAGDSNYYGHNAIVRVAAFAKHCGLPVLPGKAPLGGEILSHDFVEGALIRSGGYKVWFVPELPGSYEEMPANIIDYAKRDRRWCEGNIQHSRLLGLSILKPMGRLHLSMGFFSYLTSPLWLLLLILSSVDAMQRAIIGPVYFKPGFNLFPDWPVATDFQIDLLLGLTLAALFLPKLLGVVLVLLKRGQSRAFGGVWALCVSVVLEILFSTLVAPVMMLFQTLFVVTTFLGRSVIWDTQPRDDRGLRWREGLRHHGWQSLIGLAWAAGVYAVAPDFFWWLTPIWLGLTFVVPLSVWSSRARAGRALKHMGLFLTPEETQPPPELRRFRHAFDLKLDLPASEPIVTLEGLVPAENGLAMPSLRWPQGKPAIAQEIQYGIRDAS